MIPFYILVHKSSSKTSGITLSFLKDAASKYSDLAIKVLFVEDVDFSNLPVLPDGSLIYRISGGEQTRLLEKLLLHPRVSSFYKTEGNFLARPDLALGSPLVNFKADLPVIPTIFQLTNNKVLLKKYAEELNGFPLIIKAMGGSHGVGVMKIDSIESLYSTADYLIHQDDDFILRKFIDYKEHARLNVIGDRVVGSVGCVAVKGDFRSNVGDNLIREAREYSQEFQDIAIKAVNSLGYEFGGVDLLIDQDDKPWIAEVNFPCHFPTSQKITGIDVTSAMIDHLLLKRERLLS